MTIPGVTCDRVSRQVAPPLLSCTVELTGISSASTREEWGYNQCRIDFVTTMPSGSLRAFAKPDLPCIVPPHVCSIRLHRNIDCRLALAHRAFDYLDLARRGPAGVRLQGAVCSALVTAQSSAKTMGRAQFFQSKRAADLVAGGG